MKLNGTLVMVMFVVLVNFTLIALLSVEKEVIISVPVNSLVTV